MAGPGRKPGGPRGWVSTTPSSAVSRPFTPGGRAARSRRVNLPGLQAPPRKRLGVHTLRIVPAVLHTSTFRSRARPSWSKGPLRYSGMPGSIPGCPTMRRWRKWKARSPPKGTVPSSSLGRRTQTHAPLEKTVNLARPSTWSFAGSSPARSTQGPIGQWLGRLPFKQEKTGRNRLGSQRGRLTAGHQSHKLVNSGSSPLRATKARRTPSPDRRSSPALSFWCRSTAGRRTVNSLMLVRFQPPERKEHGDVAQLVSAPPRQGGRCGFKSRRHRARVVQRKNAVPTRRRGTFGSCRGYSKLPW